MDGASNIVFTVHEHDPNYYLSEFCTVGQVVDTMGNLLAISVHATNIHDTKSGITPAKKTFTKYPTIQRFCGDDGYRKSFEEAVLEQLGLGVDISKRIKPEFEVLPL